MINTLRNIIITFIFLLFSGQIGRTEDNLLERESQLVQKASVHYQVVKASEEVLRKYLAPGAPTPPKFGKSILTLRNEHTANEELAEKTNLELRKVRFQIATQQHRLTQTPSNAPQTQQNNLEACSTPATTPLTSLQIPTTLSEHKSASQQNPSKDSNQVGSRSYAAVTRTAARTMDFKAQLFQLANSVHRTILKLADKSDTSHRPELKIDRENQNQVRRTKDRIFKTIDKLHKLDATLSVLGEIENLKTMPRTEGQDAEIVRLKSKLTDSFIKGQIDLRRLRLYHENLKISLREDREKLESLTTNSLAQYRPSQKKRSKSGRGKDKFRQSTRLER